MRRIGGPVDPRPRLGLRAMSSTARRAGALVAVLTCLIAPAAAAQDSNLPPLSGKFPGSGRATPTPTATAQPTATPSPTATPEPTATPSPQPRPAALARTGSDTPPLFALG